MDHRQSGESGSAYGHDGAGVPGVHRRWLPTGILTVPQTGDFRITKRWLGHESNHREGQVSPALSLIDHM
ncbi:hypothetical protein [Arthrobacter glacialis]|uniref:hypothetical protein n=1 Tax=Arthrobacter glacialis TaxID=1664 RepID=UPI000CD403E4|nr:hypothetical protein [Arthrobacter glacialis]POH57161.1 hypothetical protein CVS28_17375 [Arthrobacter glacialis]